MHAKDIPFSHSGKLWTLTFVYTKKNKKTNVHTFYSCSFLHRNFDNIWQYDPDFIPRQTRLLVHLFVLTRGPQAYSTVNFPLFDGGQAMSVVIALPRVDESKATRISEEW